MCWYGCVNRVQVQLSQTTPQGKGIFFPPYLGTTLQMHQCWKIGPQWSPTQPQTFSINFTGKSLRRERGWHQWRIVFGTCPSPPSASLPPFLPPSFAPSSVLSHHLLHSPHHPTILPCLMNIRLPSVCAVKLTYWWKVLCSTILCTLPEPFYGHFWEATTRERSVLLAARIELGQRAHICFCHNKSIILIIVYHHYLSSSLSLFNNKSIIRAGLSMRPLELVASGRRLAGGAWLYTGPPSALSIWKKE